MIDMTFCLFEKHLHMDLFWLGIFYECIEISIVFKKRDHGHTLYTLRERERESDLGLRITLK